MTVAVTFVFLSTSHHSICHFRSCPFLSMVQSFPFLSITVAMTFMFLSITKVVTFVFSFVSFVFLGILLLPKYVFSCGYLLRSIIFGCSWPLSAWFPFSVQFMTLFNQKGSIFLWLSLCSIILHLLPVPTFCYFFQNFNVWGRLFRYVGLLLFMSLCNQKGSIFLRVIVAFHYLALFPTCTICMFEYFCFVFLLFVQEKRSNLCAIWILHFRVVVFFVIIISHAKLWLLYWIYMYSWLICMFVYFIFYFVEANVYLFAPFLDGWLLLFLEPHIAELFIVYSFVKKARSFYKFVFSRMFF